MWVWLSIGDCDSDSQCIGSFICFQRDGLTNVPGCVGNGISRKSNNNSIINIITFISWLTIINYKL